MPSGIVVVLVLVVLVLVVVVLVVVVLVVVVALVVVGGIDDTTLVAGVDRSSDEQPNTTAASTPSSTKRLM